MSLRRTEKTVENLWRALQTSQLSQANVVSNFDVEEHKGHVETTDPIAQPPHLTGPTSCRRVILSLICLTCIGLVCMIMTLLVQRLHLVHHHELEAHTSYTQVRHAPMPALLKRFAKLKKTTGATRGAAHDSLRDLFPHWQFDSVDTSTQPALRDLALGVSLVAQTMQTMEAQHTRAVSESSAPEAESNDDRTV